MTRWLLLAVLIAVPIALVAWVRWAAVHDKPPEFVPPEAKTQGAAKPEATIKGGTVAQPGTEPAAKPVDAEAGLRALFEGELGGVTTKGELTFYDEKTLYDAINGAAPIFLERKFRRLVSVELSAGGHDLTADVYDMTDAEHATSIFEKERSSQAKTPADWPEALVGPMSLVFHQARFYAKLTAFDAQAEAALPAFGKALREKMK